MLPGYRKKTKYIQSDRSSTGFVNMNQVLALIRKYQTEDEFYEIEPAEVLKVWLDPDEPGFPTTTDLRANLHHRSLDGYTGHSRCWYSLGYKMGEWARHTSGRSPRFVFPSSWPAG